MEDNGGGAQVQEPVQETGNAAENEGEQHEEKVSASDEHAMEEKLAFVKESMPKRRGRVKKAAGPEAENEGSRKRERKEPETPPTIIRSPRERKSIERFASSIEKEKPREFKILKGPGTQLKDIPNVVFKLSKRKGNDEALQLLHRLLYGKRVKPPATKTNILQFSGYVWITNEEKEKSKLKERIEKCYKENLLQICDVLDLSVVTSSKKEDVVNKLLEFLESPHKTSSRLYEEEEQRAKSKKRKTPTKASSKKKAAKTKSPKREEEGLKLSKYVEEDDDEDHEDDAEIEKEESEDEEAPAKKKLKSAKSVTKKQLKDERSEEEEEDQNQDNSLKGRTSSRVDLGKQTSKSSKAFLESHMKENKKKGSKVEKISKDKQKSKKMEKGDGGRSHSLSKKKRAYEDEPKVSKKKVMAGTQSSGKGNKSVSMPNDEDLCAAIAKLLQDVDLSTVTFTDVVKQLGVQFGVDLTENKSHVKGLIQQEIKRIIDAEEGEGEGEGEGGEGEGEGEGEEGGEGEEHEGQGQDEGEHEVDDEGDNEDDIAENKEETEDPTES